MTTMNFHTYKECIDHILKQAEETSVTLLVDPENLNSFLGILFGEYNLDVDMVQIDRDKDCIYQIDIDTEMILSVSELTKEESIIYFHDYVYIDDEIRSEWFDVINKGITLFSQSNIVEIDSNDPQNQNSYVLMLTGGIHIGSTCRSEEEIMKFL